MDITRCKFFFFGLAAGVGLLLPDVKIELSKSELDMFFDMEKLKALYKDEIKLYEIKLNGIPYHMSDATTNQWLGFSRR